MTKSKNKVRFASYFTLIFISYTLSITLKFFIIFLFLRKFLHKILTRHEVPYRHIMTNSNEKNKAYGIFYTYFHILRSVHYSENFSQFFSTLNDEKF